MRKMETLGTKLLLVAVAMLGLLFGGGVEAAAQVDADPVENAGDGIVGPPADERDRLSADLVVGIGVDNFAAGELQNLLNPEDANESGNRFVAGFGIDYRLTKRLWASVYTVHGVRSSEVDCTAATGDTGDSENGAPEGEMMDETGEMMEAAEGKAPAVCSLGSVDPTGIPAGESATYILKEATSLEGWLALRYELWPLLGDGIGSPASSVYLVGRAGLLSVQDSDDDVIDNHLFGVGAMITQDRFEGSFLEVGWGKTELFGADSNDRWKARALLKWKLFKGDELPGSFDALGAYAGIVVDTDGGGSGSDSVQSYFGFTFDVAALMGAREEEEDDDEG